MKMERGGVLICGDTKKLGGGRSDLLRNAGSVRRSVDWKNVKK